MDKNRGVIRIPKQNKAEVAFAIYWIWLHEYKYEFMQPHHESWNGTTERFNNEMKELREEMTNEEIEEFNNKADLFKMQLK